MHKDHGTFVNGIGNLFNFFSAFILSGHNDVDDKGDNEP